MNSVLVEGRGPKAPAPVRCLFSRGEIRLMESIADERSSFRGYSGRGDKWGRGIISNPILVGLCGEHALCRFLNERCGTSLMVDAKLRSKGDGGVDVNARGLMIQVKTRARGASNLIRRVDGAKRIRSLGCDVFVFAKWEPPVIALLGWITADAVARVAIHERSMAADHFNLRVPDEALEPMSRLATEVLNRRAA